MEFTLTFIEYFVKAALLALPLLLFFIMLIVLLGQLVGRLEAWKQFDALYWSFITAFTVGYGDIRPLRRAARIIALFVALFGIMFTGIVVAITVATATKSFDKHIDYDHKPGSLKSIDP